VVGTVSGTVINMGQVLQHLATVFAAICTE